MRALLEQDWFIGLLMSLLIAVVLGLIVGYSLLMERLAARHPRPKSESARAASDAPRPAPTPAQPPSPTLTGHTVTQIMSRVFGSPDPHETPGNTVAQDVPEAGQPIATPGNAVNDGLPGNMLPEEVREILRFQAKVEAVEAILKSGKIGQAEAVEAIFQCKRSGRPESVYARAVAAVKARSDQAYRANQDRLVELVAAIDDK